MQRRILLGLLRVYLQFDQKDFNFIKSINVLDELSKKHLDRDLREAREQKQFPNLVRLLKLKEEEGKIDAEKAKQEWEVIRGSEIGDRVSKKINTNKTPELKKLLNQIDNMFFRAPNPESRFSKNPRFLLEKLFTQLKSSEFTYQDYPHFAAYSRNLIFQHELVSKGLFDEVKQLMNLLLESLAETDEQKEAVEKVKNFKLLRKLMLLELTREEYQQLTANGQELTVKNVGTDLRVRPTEGQTHGFAPTIHMVYQNAIQFYALAEKREAAFLATIQKTLREKNTSRAVVITGGFHTEAFRQYFKENHLGYGIVAPRFEGDSHTNYVKAMLGRNPQDIETSELGNVHWTAVNASSLGVDVHARERRIE